MDVAQGIRDSHILATFTAVRPDIPVPTAGVEAVRLPFGADFVRFDSFVLADYQASDLNTFHNRNDKGYGRKPTRNPTQQDSR